MTRVIAAMRSMHGLPEPSPAKGRSKADAAEALEDAGDAYRESIRLCFLIYDVARLHRSAYDDFMRPLGITRLQWSILAELSRHDGMVQTKLAEMLDIKKTQVGVMLNKLESEGWVERRDDPLDKRVKRVYLVRPAHHIIHQMSVLAGQFGNRILGSLSVEQRKDLGSMLAMVKHDMVALGVSLGDDSDDDA